VRYPAIIQDAGGALPLYVGLIAATVGWYLVLALTATRRVTLDKALAVQTGLYWGVGIGLLWLIEVFAGNVIIHSSLAVIIVYEIAANAAYLLPAVLGVVIAYRTKQIGTGIRATLWSGMISGLMTAIGLLVTIQILMWLGISQQDPQNIQQFHQTHSHDLVSFIVGDALLGATNHLWLIGPVLNVFAGVIGGAIGKGARVINRSNSQGTTIVAQDG